MKTAKTTKADLIKQIRAKTAKAKPGVRRLFYRGIEHNKKATLQRWARQVKVTRDGDIDLSRLR